MFRIDNPTSLPTLPAIPPAGPPGYFFNGNEATGQRPTILDDWWCNSVQEEILTVIEMAGIAPDKTSQRQLYDAIYLIAVGANPDLSAYVRIAGDTMTGDLVIATPPQAQLRLQPAGTGIDYWLGTRANGDFFIHDQAYINPAPAPPGITRLTMTAYGDAIFNSVPPGMDPLPVEPQRFEIRDSRLRVIGGASPGIQLYNTTGNAAEGPFGIWNSAYQFGIGLTDLNGAPAATSLSIDGPGNVFIGRGNLTVNGALIARGIANGGPVGCHLFGSTVFWGPIDSPMTINGRVDITDILVVPGNFSAALNGDLAVTNSVNAGVNINAAQNVVGQGLFATVSVNAPNGNFSGTVSAAYLASSGDIAANGTVTAAQLTSTGNINGVNIGASGFISAGTNLSAGLDVSGNYFRSNSGGEVNAGDWWVGTGGLGRLFVNNLPNSDNTQLVFQMRGNAHIWGNGDGLSVENSNIHCGSSLIAGYPDRGANQPGWVNSANGYLINGQPAVLASVAVNDALLAADEDSAFIIRKVRNATADADSEFTVMRVGIEEPDARTGHRALYLLEEAA